MRQVKRFIRQTAVSQVLSLKCQLEFRIRELLGQLAEKFRVDVHSRDPACDGWIDVFEAVAGRATEKEEIPRVVANRTAWSAALLRREPPEVVLTPGWLGHP